MRLAKTTNLNFKRALSTKELKSYSKLIKDAKQELEIKDTNAIIFDFNVSCRCDEIV